MLKPLATLALCSLTLLAVPGCRIHSTLDAKGGATVAVKYRVGKDATLEAEKKRMESPSVTVIKAALEEDNFTNFELKVDDITKLSTAKFFEEAAITLTDGKEGTKVLTAKVTRKSPNKLPDEALAYFGKEFEVAVTLPGEVVSSNATKTDGNTVTWTYPMNDFMNAKETSMTVTYKNPAAEPAAAEPAKEPAAKPAEG